MAKRVVNIAMLALAITYTLFVATHLISALLTDDCENRAMLILASSVGVICGLCLIAAIIIDRRKHKHKKAK